MNENATEPFAVLGIAPTPDLHSIRRAYVALAKQFHPDRTRLPAEEAKERMQLLNEAYYQAREAAETRRGELTRLHEDHLFRDYLLPLSRIMDRYNRSRKKRFSFNENFGLNRDLIDPLIRKIQQLAAQLETPPPGLAFLPHFLQIMTAYVVLPIRLADAPVPGPLARRRRLFSEFQEFRTTADRILEALFIETRTKGVTPYQKKALPRRMSELRRDLSRFIAGCRGTTWETGAKTIAALLGCLLAGFPLLARGLHYLHENRTEFFFRPYTWPQSQPGFPPPQSGAGSSSDETSS